jgi:hypothetical protein
MSMLKHYQVWIAGGDSKNGKRIAATSLIFVPDVWPTSRQIHPRISNMFDLCISELRRAALFCLRALTVAGAFCVIFAIFAFLM